MFFVQNPSQNRPVCWSIVLKEKPAVDSPCFGAFPSNPIPNATKDANVHFFTHITNSSTIYKLFPVNFTSEFRELSENPLCCD